MFLTRLPCFNSSTTVLLAHFLNFIADYISMQNIISLIWDLYCSIKVFGYFWLMQHTSCQLKFVSKEKKTRDVVESQEKSIQ